MAVLKEDYSNFKNSCEQNFNSKFLRLRISSSHPRRRRGINEDGDSSECVVNMEQLTNNFHSFKVGPCQLQRKPRETKSAQLSASLRNLALSLRTARFKKRERVQFDKISCETQESDIIDAVHCLSSDANVHNREPNVHAREPNVQAREPNVQAREANVQAREPNVHSREPNVHAREPSANESKGSTENVNKQEFTDATVTTEPTQNGGDRLKNKKLKRIKSSKKAKIRKKSAKKEATKKQASRLGKLKISRCEDERRSASQPLLSSNMMKIKNIYIKTATLPKQSKSLSNVNPRLHCSSSKSHNSLCDSEEFGTASCLFGNKDASRKSVPRCTKVYLSEKHSGTIMGIPAVPPGTPGFELQQEIEWIPPLSDVKSQRAVTMKLSTIVAKQCKKEKQERQAKERKMQENEQKRCREMQAKFKQRQRAEVISCHHLKRRVRNGRGKKPEWTTTSH